MKYIVKDVNKKEVLSTTNIKEAYEYLKTHVPNEEVPPIQKIKNGINYNKKNGHNQACFGFVLDEKKKEYLILDVFCDE